MVLHYWCEPRELTTLEDVEERLRENVETSNRTSESGVVTERRNIGPKKRGGELVEKGMRDHLRKSIEKGKRQRGMERKQ